MVQNANDPALPDIHRYVRLNSLPEELKSMIHITETATSPVDLKNQLSRCIERLTKTINEIDIDIVKSLL